MEWSVCGAIRGLPWCNIWLSDNPVEVLNEHLSLLVGRYVPTKVIRVQNKDKPWFDDHAGMLLATSRRLIFGGPVITLGLTGMSLFGSGSSLPQLVTEGGGLVCELFGNANLLSDHFDRKQSREAVDLPLTCHLSHSFTTFVFRSSEVRRLLLDLDPYGGTDPLCRFPLFLTMTADVMAPGLSVVFDGLFVCLV